jgi:hypothetical protein
MRLVIGRMCHFCLFGGKRVIYTAMSRGDIPGKENRKTESPSVDIDLCVSGIGPTGEEEMEQSMGYNRRKVKEGLGEEPSNCQGILSHCKHFGFYS